MPKIQRKKIGNQIVFYKITSTRQTSTSGTAKSGPATIIEKETMGPKGKYNVYRSSISYSPYEKKWQLGNGWNLYKELNLKKATEAAKNALKYL